jgi:hypothetical protein
MFRACHFVSVAAAGDNGKGVKGAKILQPANLVTGSELASVLGLSEAHIYTLKRRLPGNLRGVSLFIFRIQPSMREPPFQAVPWPSVQIV